MNIDDLTRRAHRRGVSTRELAEIANLLAHAQPSNDLYAYLYILGRAEAKQHRAVVERFLSCETEPQLARLALEILCLFWGEPERYISYVRTFLRGVSWDPCDEVRQLAMFIAGESLRAHEDQKLLLDVLRIFQDTAAERTLREDAYSALARAVGCELAELPPAGRHMDFDRDIDPEVIVKVHRRLGAMQPA